MRKGQKHTTETLLKMSKVKLGKRFSTETRNKMRSAKLGKYMGEDNHKWVGDNISYSGIHGWILRKLGSPNICLHCNTTNAKKYEWANTDHKYKRNLKDWIRLCTSCHRKYDYENHLSNKGSGGGSISNKITYE